LKLLNETNKAMTDKDRKLAEEILKDNDFLMMAPRVEVIACWQRM